MNHKERIQSEVKLLSIKYGKVESYEKLGIIVIKNYKLPDGWNKKSTDILLTIPPGYPTAPPYAFKTSEYLRLDSDRIPSNYTEGQIILDKNWAQFSISVQEWKPSEDVISGHNLLTFMTGVENRLEELN